MLGVPAVGRGGGFQGFEGSWAFAFGCKVEGAGFRASDLGVLAAVRVFGVFLQGLEG